MKKKDQNANGKDVRVILHDIRSTHNVGSIFRTADAAGVSRIYISGYTPSPLDRFERVQKDIAKTALGAELSVAWEKVENKEGENSLTELITKLKKEGFTVIALEQDERSVDYVEFSLPEKAVIIVGNEVDGVDPTILDQCDVVVEIPMHGEKESLNVSVAFGVALFRML